MRPVKVETVYKVTFPAGMADDTGGLKFVRAKTRDDAVWRALGAFTVKEVRRAPQCDGMHDGLAYVAYMMKADERRLLWVAVAADDAKPTTPRELAWVLVGQAYDESQILARTKSYQWLNEINLAVRTSILICGEYDDDLASMLINYRSCPQFQLSTYLQGYIERNPDAAKRLAVTNQVTLREAAASILLALDHYVRQIKEVRFAVQESGLGHI